MDNSSSGGSNATPCPKFDWFATDIEHPAYLCQLAVSCLGLLLNGLTLCVFATGKEFKGAPFVFMWALALSDICNLLFKAPECFVMATREKPKRLQFVKDAKLYLYYTWSNYLNPLCNMTENVSVWLIVCLALERYISMKHYNISKTRCTSRNAVIVTLGILAVAFLINIFSFFGMRAKYGKDGNETFVYGKASYFYSTVWYEACVWLRACAAQFLPLVFLAVANCRLILVLHRQSRKMKKYSRPAGAAAASAAAAAEACAEARAAAVSPVKRSSMNSRRHMAQRRLTIMLIVVIGMVLFGQIPQAFSFHKLFTLIFSCPHGCSLDKCLVYRKHKLLANVPNLLCYSCNFFIYFALNKHFRGHVFRLLACRRDSARRPSANGLYAAQPDVPGATAAATAAAIPAASSAGSPLLPPQPDDAADGQNRDDEC